MFNSGPQFIPANPWEDNCKRLIDPYSLESIVSEGSKIHIKLKSGDNFSFELRADRSVEDLANYYRAPERLIIKQFSMKDVFIPISVCDECDNPIKTIVPGGSIMRMCARPQIPTKIESFEFPDEIADSIQIHNFSIGNRSQLTNCGKLTAKVWRKNSENRPKFNMDIIYPGLIIALEIENKSHEPIDMDGCFFIAKQVDDIELVNVLDGKTHLMAREEEEAEAAYLAQKY